LTLICPNCKKSVNGQYLQLQQQADRELKEVKRKQSFLVLNN
jgi:hypothetical protein